MPSLRVLPPLMSETLLRIDGGAVYDPANGVDGEIRDIWIRGRKVIDPPADPDARPDRTIDATGLVVMPGGVDIHSHIAGPKVNVARKMRPEEKRKDQPMHATPVLRSG